MGGDETRRPVAAPQKRPSIFEALNERAKRLNDVKVNVFTVVIFLGCLAVLTFVATSLAYITHRSVQGIERPRG